MGRKRTLPPAPMASVPADRVRIAASVEADLRILREATRIREVERVAAIEAAELQHAQDERARHGERPEPVELVRAYLESGGTLGFEWHGYGWKRRAIHGQEVGDWLERHGWPAAPERLDGIFRRMVAEGVVEPAPLRVGDPPPWCSTYGMAFPTRTNKRGQPCRTAPNLGWWDLSGSRGRTLDPDERREADR